MAKIIISSAYNYYTRVILQTQFSRNIMVIKVFFKNVVVNFKN